MPTSRRYLIPLLLTVTGACFVRNAVEPSLSLSTLQASPTTLVADGQTVASLSVLLRDAQAAPLVDAPVVFTSNSAGAQFTQPKSSDANGYAQGTVSSTTVGVQTITAWVGPRKIPVPMTAQITFVAGPAASQASTPASANTTLVISPSAVVANNSSQATLSVSVANTFNNPVPNIAVSIVSDGTGDTLASTNGNTDSLGHWVTTMTSSKAEVKTLTAAIGGFTKSATVTFVAGPVASATLTATPNSLTADNSNTVLTVTAVDANNNAVSGQAVSFTTTGTAYAFGAANGNTAAGGTYVTTLSSTKAEVKRVTATLGTVVANANVTFNAGSPNATKSFMTTTPSTLVADNIAASTISVKVEDQYANPVQGQQVALLDTGTADTFSNGMNGYTTVAGVFATNMKSTNAQTKVINAVFAGITFTASITFVAGPAVPAKSTLTVNPNSGLLANNIAAATVSVLLRDQYNNLAINDPISFSAFNTSSTGFALQGNTSNTAAFSFALTSRFAGPKAVNAYFNGRSMSALATFTQPASYCATSPFYGVPPLLANGTGTLTDTKLVDMNSDGKLDAVFADGTLNAVQVALGKGNGRFGAVNTYATSQATTTNVVTCDINADGHPDVVSIARSGYVSVFFGSALGTLGSRLSLTVTGADMGRYGVACADMTHDGKLDVMVAYASGNGVEMFPGNGSGGFAAGIVSALPLVPYGFAVGTLREMAIKTR